MGTKLIPAASAIIFSGIILVLISGYIGIAFWPVHRLRALMAVLFGIGAALTIDEFALWLYLKDVYWEKQ